MKLIKSQIIKGLVLCMCVFSGLAMAEPLRPVKIGALLPLTGQSSSHGELMNATLEVAFRDVNQFFKQLDSPLRFEAQVEDTGTDPGIAREKLQKLKETGVQVFLGPETSAELAAVSDDARAGDLLLISSTSTASDMPRDVGHSVRFSLNDAHEVQTLARVLRKQGVSTIVPLVRQDVWGTGYALSLMQAFEKLGGTAVQPIYFEPEMTDYSAVLNDLAEQATLVGTQVGQDQVAIVLIAMDETSRIFSQASQQDLGLSQKKWFGSGSSYLDTSLLHPSKAAQFARESGFQCVVFAPISGPSLDVINEKLRPKTERVMNGYSAAAYDALRLLSYAYLAAGADADVSQLRKTLETMSETYQGLSGETAIDAQGQRKYGRFQHFELVQADHKVNKWQSVDQFLLSPSGWWSPVN